MVSMLLHEWFPCIAHISIICTQADSPGSQSLLALGLAAVEAKAAADAAKAPKIAKAKQALEKQLEKLAKVQAKYQSALLKPG